ncbi:TonB-dependent receptor domain-containing protein [Motilimonas pumila]|uniref:TonB-dependent receptor n=1 Tax=Motilimonas pumila TaxID=2303987 RepID=A0A418YB45_9GAMM|nr:TonB-dependent receptor [Motilimonas pumila]RJG40192.1 TonB-dependent receptor [Motilimonas pumila]
MKTQYSPLALLVASCFASPFAHGQSQLEAAQREADNTPETIVVVGELTNFEVTDEELKKYQANDLADIFRTVPSVTVGGSLGVAQKIYVRGLEDTFLNVTVDGAPQTSTLFHHMGRLSIDPYLLKSVEVQAGAGEATSGAGAIGGAIRFKTKDIDDLLDPGKSIGGLINASYFSNDGYRAGGSFYGRIKDTWGMLGSYTYVDNNIMQDGHGDDIPGSASERKLGFFKVNGDLTDNQSLTFSYENRIEEGDFAQRPNWPATEDATLYPLELERDTFILNHQLLGNQYVNLETTLYHTTAEVVQDIYDRWGQYRGKVSSVGFDLRNTSDIAEHSVTYGVEYRSDEAKAGSLEADSTGDVKEDGDVLGLYVQDHWQLHPSLLLSYGLRYDRYDMKQHATGVSVDSDGFSPNIGFNFEFADYWMLNAGYAQAMRGKQIGDTFTLESKAVDPDLKPEEVENIEVGIEFQKGNFIASATVFQSTIDNVINTPIGSHQYENVGKLKTEGYELKAEYWYGDLYAVASFNSYDSELNGHTVEGYEHNGLGNSRGDTFGLNLAYNVTPDIELGWNFTYVADLDNIEVLHRAVDIGWIDEVQTIDKPGYQVHDIYAQWLPLSDDSLSLNFTVTNLFDEYYRDHSSVGDYSSIPDWGSVSGIHERGRDIRVSASYKF